jgi:hypothetical protein
MGGERDAFEALPWHDAALREIVIDRRNAGKVDEVLIRVTWPHGGAGALRFSDCYGMNAALNFGIIAEETISGAAIDDSDADLLRLCACWKPLGVNLDSLVCFRVEISSTGSVIRIYAKRFEVLSESAAG